MARPLKIASILSLATAAALAGGTVTASAAPGTRVVRPGQSIQGAIDAAHPGDTIIVQPGVYHENIEIKKNDITLRGAGGSPEGTVLMPPARPNHNDCFGNAHAFDAVCVAALQFDPKSGKVIRPVSGTHIRGLLIQGFPGVGIVGFGSNNMLIEYNQFVDNAAYGAAAFVGSGNRFLYNSAIGSGEAGFYIGDSPHANATLTGNFASNNGDGIFVREASSGTISSNDVEGNCVGILLLDTPGGAMTSDWNILQNRAVSNNKACPAGEDIPRPMSGTGIALVGASLTLVESNTALANKPSNASLLGGGIVLVGFPGKGGSPALNDTVRFNTAYRDRPFDIRYDGSGGPIGGPGPVGTGPIFVANYCGTSQPAVICR